MQSELMSMKTRLASGAVWAIFAVVFVWLVTMAARTDGLGWICYGALALLMLVLPFWFLAGVKELARDLSDDPPDTDDKGAAPGKGE
ncbi:MAG: hypothetical protein ACRCSU_11925 [Paracoccaceae bacterium]